MGGIESTLPPYELNFQGPITDYLGGPTDIFYLESPNSNKRFYLIGEKHIEKEFCQDEIRNGKVSKEESAMHIVDYLDELFKTTTVFIDFYIELALFSEKEMTLDYYLANDDTINKMLNKFLDCIILDRKTNCPYSKVRIHSVDVRNTFSEKYAMSRLMHFFSWLSNGPENVLLEQVKKNELIFLNLSNINSFESFKDFMVFHIIN
jgi:hypothetical protein